MTDHPTFSDEELTAFLDGEHEHAPVSAIEAAQREDPALRERLEALTIDRVALRSAFETFLNTSGPATPDLPGADDVTQRVLRLDHPANTTGGTAARSRSVGGVLSRIAAVGLVSLGLGYAAGYVSPDWSGLRSTILANRTDAPTPAAKPGWKAAVAQYQSLYAAATLAHVSRTERERRTELDRVLKAIGKDTDLQTLARAKGLTYKRGQILSFNGKPLVQLAFLSATGEPVALCIIRNGKPAAPTPALAEMENMQAASWVRDGYDYLLIGGADADLIRTTADTLAPLL